jgi:rubrerythrin
MSTTVQPQKVSMKNFSVEKWFEIVPRGYLKDMMYGRSEQYNVPEIMMVDGMLRRVCLYDLAIFANAERVAVQVASGLTALADDDATRIFLATQTFDEARHYEIFCQRLRELGVDDEEREFLIKRVVFPKMQEFIDMMVEQVENGDLLGGIIALNIILEGMAFPLYNYEAKYWKPFDPGLSEIIMGAFKDETRHVGFAEHKMMEVLSKHPDQAERLSKLASKLSKVMTETFEIFLKMFVSEYQEACQEHAELIGDTEVSPGMRMIDTPVHKNRAERIGLRLEL